MNLRAAMLAAVLVCGACRDPEPTPPPPTRKLGVALPHFTPPAGFTKLRLGLVPFLSKETISTANEKLAAYLSRVLQVPVETIVADNYGDAVDRLERGEFDLVVLSPLSYVEAARRMKLNCLVQTIADGSDSASGYIFVRDDSPRRTLADLKGASFGFVDPMSTSGSLLPRRLLRENGFDLKKDLGSAEYLGDHEAVLMAVLEGRVEVGATYQGAFGALRKSHGVDPLSFRVVAKTPRTPRDIFCARPEVPKEVTEAITAALLDLSGRDRAGREILGPLNLNGFTAADTGRYELIRAAAEELEQ